MNKKQKDKFLKTIQKLDDLLQELNSGCESWELRYNTCDCRFSLYKRDICTHRFNKELESEIYFPYFYVEE